MKEYYECHITIDLGFRSELLLKDIVEQDLRWKFSMIEGDPDLGHGIKGYATMHYNIRHDKEDIIKWLDNAAQVLYDHDFNVIRRKIELVIHDDRSAMKGKEECQ